jgi:integrase
MGSAATGYLLGKLNGRFVVTWWEGTKRRRYRLGRGITKGQADADLIKFVKSRELALTQDTKTTIAGVMDLYLKDRKIDGKSIEKQRHSWKALAPTFQHLGPDDVSKELCDQYRKGRLAAGRKVGTIWTELSVLRAALNWAVKRETITKAPHIFIGDQPAPKDRHLTRNEADQLLAAVGMPHLKLFIHLALGTAGRASALFELTWDRVDFQRRQINLRTTEQARNNKRRSIVPINDTLLAALLEAKEGALTPYVLEWAGHPIRTVKGAFERACARCGWDDVTPHVLRHTAAVWMAEAGVPMAVISQYLGHTSTAVTEKVYARFSPEYLKTAASALEMRAA